MFQCRASFVLFLAAAGGIVLILSGRQVAHAQQLPAPQPVMRHERMVAMMKKGEHPIGLTLNVGGYGDVGLSADGSYGGYTFIGLSLYFPVTETFFLVPGVMFEVAPHLGNWGFEGNFATEFMLTRRLSLDVHFFLADDQDPKLFSQPGHGASFSFGFGPALSFNLTRDLSISACLSVGRGIRDPGWDLFPGLSMGVDLL